MLTLCRRVKKYGLCPNDLNVQIGIYSRDLGSTGFGDNDNAGNKLTLSFSMMSGVETVNPFKHRFGSEISNKTTHIFVLRYSPNILSLDTANNFIKCRGMYYRIEGVENLNENNRVLFVYCSQRGNSVEATA